MVSRKYSKVFFTLFIRNLYLGGPYEQVKTFSGLGRYSRNSLCWRRNEVERSVEGRIDEERCVRGRIDEERSVGGRIDEERSMEGRMDKERSVEVRIDEERSVGGTEE